MRRTSVVAVALGKIPAGMGNALQPSNADSNATGGYDKRAEMVHQFSWEALR
jgi:hypothetical protein